MFKNALNTGAPRPVVLLAEELSATGAVTLRGGPVPHRELVG